MRRGLSPAKSVYALLVLFWAGASYAQLPPVPVPIENPITEPKRVLGKVLFWDEQLSSDDTVACGTCHRPAFGGSDPRPGLHPGDDPGTLDDVGGSPGIRRFDADGRPKHDPVFADNPQVTPRSSPNFFAALWADAIFWDGRAAGAFIDPISGDLLIESGAALENQALAALSNAAEMTHEAHDWHELTAKLEAAIPLALATNLPPDVAQAVSRTMSYPELFADAFGGPDITPSRIAFALAAYQRTLVADQTSWDRFINGDTDAMTPAEQIGWRRFQSLRCTSCHEPPLFASNRFLNIGLRRSEFDPGRIAVTGDPADAGAFRVPSLRNSALKSRYMHTGEFNSLNAAIGFYRDGAALPDRDDFPDGGIYAFNMGQLDIADLAAFIRTLTDPRVEAEVFPFDRPTLQSERR